MATVGEVLTFFEGRAEQLFKTIEAVEKKLQALASKTYEFKVAFPKDLFPVGDIVKALERVEQKLDQFTERIDELADDVVTAARKVGKQIDDITDNTLDRVGKQTILSTEGIASKVILGIGGALAAIPIAKFLQRQFSATVEEGGGILRRVLNFASDQLSFISTTVLHLVDVGRTSLPLVDRVLAGLGYAKGILLGSSIFLFGVPLLLREVNMLVGRARKDSLAGLTVVNQLTTLIAFTFNTITLSVFRIKTGLLGIGVLLSPLLVGMPTILLGLPLIFNTAISFFTSGIQKVGIWIGTKFGSGRAILAKAIQDVKALVTIVSPAILRIAKDFGTASGNAEKAAKQVRAFGVGNRELVALSRTKLPLGVQFQLGFAEARIALNAIFVQLNTIVLTLQRGFHLADTEIADISAKAQMGAAQVQGQIEKTGNKLQGLSGRKGFLAGLKDFFDPRQSTVVQAITRWGASLKGFIGGFKEGMGLPRTRLGGPVPKDALAIGKKLEQQQKQETVEAKLFEQSWTATEAKVKTVARVGAQVKQTIAQAGTAVATMGQIATAATITVQQNVGQIAGRINTTLQTLRELYDIAKISKVVLAAQEKFIDPRHPKQGVVLGVGAQLPLSLSNIIDLSKKILIVQRELRGEGIFGGEAGRTIESLKTKLMTFSKLSESLSKKLGLPIIRIPDISKFVIQPEAIQKALDKLNTEFQKLPKELQVIGNKGAISLVGTITRGLKEGKKEVQPVLDAFTELVAAYFPQSPAKRGALRGIVHSGQKIVSYLAQGILAGRGFVDKATASVSERIASFFPRSISILGPLIHLVAMGMKIPYYLGKGIIRGIKSAVGGIEQLTGAIIGHIENVIRRTVELSHSAERIGLGVEQLSSLDYILRSVGASASEVEFTFARINEKIATGFSPEEMEKIGRLGINLQAVAQSADPAMAMFYEIATILKTLPSESEKFKDALELIGLTANSKVVNVLRKGGDEIKRLQQEAVKAGVVVTKEMGESASKFDSLVSRLTLVKETLLNDFVNAILPNLIEKGEKILKLVEENRVKIQAGMKMAGEGLIAILAIADELFKLLINKPDQFLNLMIVTFTATVGFIGKTITDFLIRTGPEIVNFVWAVGKPLIGMASDIAKQMMDAVLSIFKDKWNQILAVVIRGKYEIGLITEEEFSAQMAVLFPDKQKQERELRERAENARGYIALWEKLNPMLHRRIALMEEMAALEEQIAAEETLSQEATGKRISFEVVGLREVLSMRQQELQQLQTDIPPLQETVDDIVQDVRQGIRTGRINAENLGLKDPGIEQEIKEAVSRLGKAATSPELAEQVKANFDEAKQKILTAAEGTDLAPLVQKLMAVFSKENYDQAIKGFEQVNQDIKEKMDEAQTIVQNAANGILDSIADVKDGYKTASQEIAMTFAQLDDKLRRGEAALAGEEEPLGAGTDVALLELRRQQAEAARAFEENLAKQRQAVNWEKLSPENAMLYRRQEIALREAFREKQRTEESQFMETEWKKMQDQSTTRVRLLNEGVVSGLSDAFSQAVKTLAEKGKLAMSDIANIAREMFNKSFESVLTKLKAGFEDVLVMALEGIGASSKIVAGALEGIFAIGALIMSRIKSETQTTFAQIDDGIEQIQEKTRGVIAGDITVPLQNVMQQFSMAQVPVTLRLDRLIQLGEEIRDALLGRASVAGTGYASLGLVEHY